MHPDFRNMKMRIRVSLRIDDTQFFPWSEMAPKSSYATEKNLQSVCPQSFPKTIP